MTFVSYPRTTHIKGSNFQDGDHDLKAVSWSQLKGKFLVVEEKVDGCVSGDTTIDTLEHGKIQISHIVNDKLKVHVLSRDIEHNEDVYSKVTHHHIKQGVDEWFLIDTGIKKIKVTGNHLFYLPELKCWRRADELTTDDVVWLQQEKDGE